MNLLLLLFKFLSGGGVSAIGEQINRAIQIRETANTAEAKLQAEQNIEQLKTARDIEVKQLEARVNEKPDRVTKILRCILAAPAFFILFKMTTDFVHVGLVDEVPDQLWWYVNIVVAWCFLARPWGKR